MTRLACCAIIVLGACATSPTDSGTAPQIGKADSSDRADRACQVVLRGVGFKAGSPYARRDGWIVWEGHVEAAQQALDDGAEVGVLYHRAYRDWFEVVAQPTNEPGLFSFEMSYGITSGNEGGSSWSEMEIELVPFLRLADGSRVFDHNANNDDIANYVLDYSWGTGRRPFELDSDPTVCP